MAPSLLPPGGPGTPLNPPPNPGGSVGSGSAAEAFIRANTRLLSVPEAPDIQLFLADEITPLWEASETALSRAGVAPPYWAFAWPGSRALACLVRDRPDLVAGRTVLDVATGCGLAAFAAARAGARSVMANDIDPYALEAVRLAALHNDVVVEILPGDLTLLPAKTIMADTVLVGDVCYEADTAERMIRWLRELAAAGVTVYLADPGRKYAPAAFVEPIAHYTIATTLDLETTISKDAVVWRIHGAG